MGYKRALPACPVAATVALIGSKWKLLILRALASGPCRFRDLSLARGQQEGIEHSIAIYGRRRPHKPLSLSRPASMHGV